MRLLLIEDEEEAAAIIAKALRHESHTVELAFDGKAGLGKALSFPFNLIILDNVYLSRMVGQSATSCVKLVYSSRF